MVAEEEQDAEGWLGSVTPPKQADSQTSLNYVIPNRLAHLLARYCAQTGVKSSPLVRRLITDFLKGESGIDLEDLKHPNGRRTQVMLPARLLTALEQRCEEIEAPTKAAVIAALLADFLPPRVQIDDASTITVRIPSEIFSKIYERYGPGPAEELVVEALCDLIQKTESRAAPAEQEA
jgi:hypothetical protein